MAQKAVHLFLMMCFLSATLLTAQNAREFYQRGLVQEQAAGDLKQAVELYQRAAKEAGNDRTLAAKALVRAAASYEKLGSPEAPKVYEQVLRSYPEQREQVMVAQRQLAFLRRSVSLRSQSASTDISSTVGPMIRTYCVTCHNQTRRVGGLTLDNVDLRNVSVNADLWEKVLRRLRARREPISGPRPDEATYQSVIAPLEIALDHSYPANTAEPVDDAQLASRLATFLWNSSPDAALMDAANRGRLKDPSVIEQQVRRMIRDSKTSGFVTSFFSNWLHFQNLDSVLKEPAMRDDFARETHLFLQYQLREDRTATELWSANYTFVNERLARHYGISNVSGDDFRRVSLDNNTRGGLLGHGSILTLTSVPQRTSPTLRGKWILNAFFGLHPPPPPPNIPPLPEGSDPMRKRIEDATAQPMCASCHRMFDPLGFALENFNGIGGWRDVDGGAPVNSSASFLDGTRFNGPAEFRAGLMKYRDAYLTNVTEQLLAQALGRAMRVPARVYSYEMPAVRAIVREAAANDFRWSSLITGIVKSAPFQMKTIVP